MLRVILRYYHTLKYLQWIQIKYRLRYLFARPQWATFANKAKAVKVKTQVLKWSPGIASNTSRTGEKEFEFLNIKQKFAEKIDWNFAEHGKLWTYNLNYFDFLQQTNISKAEGLHLIHDFIGQEENSKDGMEPFPISLRLLSWVKFIQKHQIQDPLINQSIFRQVQLLSATPEYHLLGNHLLENAFALLFGAAYIADQKILAQAKAILKEQLEEQILADGGHFELSPMYHQIMLYRVLDSINLLQNNAIKATDDLLVLLKTKAELMLGWMEQMTFANGKMAMLNDSAPGIAPEAKDLLAYAKRLDLAVKKIPLKECGYRKIIKTRYEMIADVGAVGPDYIPGHAHSDTLGFVLYHRNEALLVDTGITTYEKNARRTLERSTAAHNTVCIAGEEQTEVWGGFRVARRAQVRNLKESPQTISASHNGYQKIKCTHHRVFDCQEKVLVVKDTIAGNKKAKAFFHFHPDQKISLIGKEVRGDFGRMLFSEFIEIEQVDYLFGNGFNQTRTAQKIVIAFEDYLETKIELQ